MSSNLLHLNWPAAKQVNALSTTRQGGFSKPPFDSFNLGLHVGDDQHDVQKNRTLLTQSLPRTPKWLDQTHSADIIIIDETNYQTYHTSQADGFYTRLFDVPLAIMTADCLPIFLADKQGTQIAIVHGGWRGLAEGIIKNTLSLFSSNPADVIAYLGPAIGPLAFEVGEDVVRSFSGDEFDKCFKKQTNGKFMADIFAIASVQLNALQVEQIYSDKLCTFSDPARFFSYRRDGETGRLAHLIWLSKS
ncbi:yfiH [Pseudoalteromonas ulvae UL12]|uniref:peptidoglycan editing factor PgeF n=1 Tax=Pseudoalteromonas ulvae TaxID=107327 RepID=UPI00186B7C8B|nr:peptidoglycan editing factor PgeF [Pseudoalteromonas ulvae]MBE0362628.1 yfiH [Pseudoalteromonas ulvae UL12]